MEQRLRFVGRLLESDRLIVAASEGEGLMLLRRQLAPALPST
jgi:hypothetical protein